MDIASGRFRVDKSSDSSTVTEYISVTLEQERPDGTQFADVLPLGDETSLMSGESSWWHECSVVLTVGSIRCDLRHRRYPFRDR